MSTYKELVHLVLDELKMVSDDSHFREEHILFLLDKYRTFILKQRYNDIKKAIPDSNYQTICLTLVKVDAIDGGSCDGTQYLKSVETIPNTTVIASPKLSSLDLFQGNIQFVSRERFKWAGKGRYAQNIIYGTIATDNHLYIKSSNPQFLYLEKVKLTAVFEDSAMASQLSCFSEQDTSACDVMDNTFPMEEALIPPMVELIVKELSGAVYKPKDILNDAADNLSKIANSLEK